MSRWVLTAWLLAFSLSSAFAEEAVPDKKGVAFFEKRIRPVLVESCYECHSAKSEKAKGGLTVDSRDSLLRGGESGPAIVPGSPNDSLLIEALKHDGLEMPPNKKLSDRVIADFVAWIKMGAPDPREAIAGAEHPAKKEIDIEAGRQFWAFQPPKVAEPPKVKNQQWPKSDIDKFVLADLEANGLTPVSDADRRTLLRRVYLDLIGLPPTPEEVDAFVNDSAPTLKLLEPIVDRLLASPQFGERWGRHWLDVVRFAESNGNTDNVTYPHAWRYRDYVINAFNSDKPFDRFITEQLAGDLLPSQDPKERDMLLTATGFLALGSKPRSQNNPDFSMDLVAEQIEVATTGFMALTVACARCHDHKFDPIPTSEYYAMAGIFTSTESLYSAGGGQGNGRLKNTGFHTLTGNPNAAEIRQKHDAAVAELRKERQTLVVQLRQLGAIDRVVAANNAKNAKNNKQAQKQAKKLLKQQGGPKPEEPNVEVKIPNDASPEQTEKIKRLGEELRHIIDEIKDREANAPPAAELAMGVRDEKKPADCKICLRGDSQKRGDDVPRGFVTVATIGDMPKIPADRSGRLQLAEWMASPQNPLTARVISNRIWQHLFGRGIVASVDNFGVLGEKPSHPELLDQLALQFVSDGWSVKKLVRSLVLTRNYGLASTHDSASYERDPDNVFLWRHTPRRMDSDQIRDAILAVSGQIDLDPRRGSDVAKHGEQEVQRQLSPSTFTDIQNSHRSIYLPIVRNAMPEALDLFDAPDPSLVIGVRDATNVPAQSLFLMNSPFLVDQSRHFAARILSASDLSDAERINFAFRLSYGRAASESEKTQAAQFLDRARIAVEQAEKDKTQIRSRTWATFSQALFASAEFRYVE